MKQQNSRKFSTRTVHKKHESKQKSIDELTVNSGTKYYLVDVSRQTNKMQTLLAAQ